MSDPSVDLTTELNAVKAVNVTLSNEKTALQSQLVELEDLRWLVGHLALGTGDTVGVPTRLVPLVTDAMDAHNPDAYAEDLLVVQPVDDVPVDEDA